MITLLRGSELSCFFHFRLAVADDGRPVSSSTPPALPARAYWNSAAYSEGAPSYSEFPFVTDILPTILLSSTFTHTDIVLRSAYWSRAFTDPLAQVHTSRTTIPQ